MNDNERLASLGQDEVKVAEEERHRRASRRYGGAHARRWGLSPSESGARSHSCVHYCSHTHTR